MQLLEYLFAPLRRDSVVFSRDLAIDSSNNTRLLSLLRRILLSVILLGASAGISAQTTVTPRITAPIDNRLLTRLTGNTHPLAQTHFDEGPADPSTPMHVTLMFKMTAMQQADLDVLLAVQQKRGSAEYHRWLTPEQFGSRFGLNSSDLEKVKAWLESNGFRVDGVPASRNMIRFSGSAGQVRSALHTEIHRYAIDAEEHFANSNDPSVPAALADLILSIRGLNDFRMKPRARRVMNPKFTAGVGGYHFVTPPDLATIYGLEPLYMNHFDGTGQKIAVVGQSDVVLSDIQNFRKAAGLPANDPQGASLNASAQCPCIGLLVPGDTDPGLQPGDIDEANLDVEYAGALAPNATVIFIVGGVAPGQGGVFDALDYAITTSPVPAPIVSTSYGLCEQFLTGTVISAFTSLMQQANAEGITVLAAGGDTGAADCDFNPGPPTPITTSTMGLAVDFPGALANVTSVGGTEFNEGSGSYWAPASGSMDLVSSALSYIPETSWNDTNFTFSNGTSVGLTAGGGGSSAFIPKPTWQIGTGVPNDGARDVPDISISASLLHDAYLFCTENYNSATNTFSPTCSSNPPSFRGNGTVTPVGGTSVGPPTMAGIVALLNQYTAHSTGSGNINPTLYALATQTPTAFHDISTGNNQVPFSAPCAASTQIGYNAGPGYDLATGLGSLDAFVLITNWTSVSAAISGNATLVDFSLAFSPTKLTVKAGSCGTAQLLLSPLKGFAGTPSFSCTVASGLGSTTCAVVPAPVVTSFLAPGSFSDPDWRGPATVVLVLLLSSFGVILLGSRTRYSLAVLRPHWIKVVPFASLVVMCAAGLSCGGGNSGSNGAPAVAPSIVAQPASQTVVEGQTTTFSISANGTAPLSYQWSKNGAPISGATSSTYTTPAATAADQGDQFTVSVSNSAGTVVSNAATLNINVPYNFVVQVPSGTAAGSATLTVTAQIGGIAHTAQMTLTVQ